MRPIAAQRGTLRARGITFEVSPRAAVPLGSFKAGGRPWGGVADAVEINMIALDSGDSSMPTLLVGVDALYVGRKLRDTIAAATGLPAERILTFASHTHRAPMLDDSKPLLGSPEPGHLQRVLNMAEAHATRLVSAPRAPAELLAAKGNADHSINRRLRKALTLSLPPTFGKVVNAPNVAGPRDETIITATVRDSVGRALGVIWNYACHPVAGPHANVVSAHFPGVVRSSIRSAEGDAELPVIYVQGFSGNTRPKASANATSVVRKIQRFLTGPVFEDMSPERYDEWARGLAETTGRVRSQERALKVDGIGVRRQNMRAEEFYTGGGPSVTFARVSIGAHFAIVGMNAEVMAEYAPRVRNMVGGEFVCCAGCMDDSFGYLPTAAILGEGGYEASGFCAEFGIGRVLPSAESAALQGFRAVARAAESGVQSGAPTAGEPTQNV